MVKDIEKLFLKAEKLYKAMQYKRAAKIFDSVGDAYLDLGKFELARDCFFDAAKCSINEEIFDWVRIFKENGKCFTFK